MSKIIKYDEEAKNSVIAGIDAVANIVKTTVGPKGRNVLIRNEISKPIITNDGVTIAKAIVLKDNAEDAGAQLIIQAANQTNEIAGDGTTTTTILAQEMIHQYYDMSKSIDEYVNVVQVQKDMVKTSEAISNYLSSIATPVNSIEDIERVATISSGSAETGKLLAQAFDQAGEYGSVIVEDSKTGKNNLVSIQGMKLSSGSVTPYLLNDRINMKTDMLDAEVLITKDKIDSVTEFFTVLDAVVQTGKKLLVICDDIEYEPLNMVLMNKAKGAPLNISIIRLPGFGELRENLVEDICIATGATLMGRDIGLTLKDFKIEYLGQTEQVIVTQDDAVIKFKDMATNGSNLLEARQQRVEELKATMERVNKDDQEQYKRRISNLVSGIAVIEVGGNSDVEIKDKKLRLEDAINSVQAAKEEGIVPGGGYSFLLAGAYLTEQRADTITDITLGEAIVYNSLRAVTRQIAENSGMLGDDIVNECLEKELGYNALTNSFENLLETGVINSVKVDRYSLINATSVASTVITMGGLIVNENEKDQNVLQLQAPLSMM